MITELYSKGLYSTWIFLPETNIAFDCGEGLSTQLGEKCFAIDKLFISHSHIDHIAGIIPFLGIRRAGMGDKTTPLSIYYPKGSTDMEELKAYSEKLIRNPTYELTWIPIKPNQEIPLAINKEIINNKGEKQNKTYKENLRIKAFNVVHGKVPENQALGFSLLEKRSRLKKEYKGLKGKELEELKNNGEKITEYYDKNLLVYSGDCSYMDKKEASNTDLLIYDTTFLKTEDRDKGSSSHATLEEVIKFSKEVEAKQTHCIHISPRYKKKEIIEIQQTLKSKHPTINLVSHNQYHILGRNPQQIIQNPTLQKIK